MMNKLHTTIINNLGSGSVSFNALKNNQADISAIRYVGTDLSHHYEKKKLIVTQNGLRKRLKPTLTISTI